MPNEIHDTYDALISILQRYCGERGESEGAVETLDRIIRERCEQRLARAEAECRLNSVHGQLNAVIADRDDIIQRLRIEKIENADRARSEAHQIRKRETAERAMKEAEQQRDILFTEKVDLQAALETNRETVNRVVPERNKLDAELRAAEREIVKLKKLLESVELGRAIVIRERDDLVQRLRVAAPYTEDGYSRADCGALGMFSTQRPPAGEANAPQPSALQSEALPGWKLEVNAEGFRLTRK